MDRLSSAGISKKKVRRFMYHVYRTSRLRQERQVARHNLREQLERLKAMQIGDNRKRAKLVSEIKNLEQLIDIVVDNEHKNIVISPASHLEHDKLQKRVNELYDKLSEYLIYQQKRQKRIKEIEEKVRGKTSTKEHPEFTGRLLSRIDALEQRFQFLKSRGLASPEELAAIRARLDGLRGRIL